jgi:hypothetical protein
LDLERRRVDDLRGEAGLRAGEVALDDGAVEDECAGLVAEGSSEPSGERVVA